MTKPMLSFSGQGHAKFQNKTEPSETCLLQTEYVVGSCLHMKQHDFSIETLHVVEYYPCTLIFYKSCL